MTTVTANGDEGISAPESVTRLFTFGYGHVCPFTGKNLGDHYALVTAPDRSSARTLMNQTFNRQWAFEYDGLDDPRLGRHADQLKLHADLRVGSPAS